MFWSFLFNIQNGTAYNVVNQEGINITDLMIKNSLINILSTNPSFFGTDISSQLFIETSLSSNKSNNWNIGIPIYPIGFANSSFQDERHSDKIIDTLQKISIDIDEGIKIRLYSNDLLNDAITSTTQILTTEGALDTAGSFNNARRTIKARHRNRYGLETDGTSNSNLTIGTGNISSGSYFYSSMWISADWISNNDNVLISNYDGTDGWYLKSTNGEGAITLFYTDKDGTEQFAEYYVPPTTYTDTDWINIGIKFRPPDTNGAFTLGTFTPASPLNYKVDGTYGTLFTGGSITQNKIGTGEGLTISFDVVANNIDSTSISIVNRGSAYSVGDEVYIGMEATMTGDDAPPRTSFGTINYTNASIVISAVNGGKVIDFYINGTIAKLTAGQEYIYPNFPTIKSIIVGSQYDGSLPSRLYMDDFQLYSSTYSDNISTEIISSLYNKGQGNCGQGYNTLETDQYKTTGLTVISPPTSIGAGDTLENITLTMPSNCTISNTKIYLRITLDPLSDLSITLTSPDGTLITIFDGTIITNTGDTIDCWIDDLADTDIQSFTGDITNKYVSAGISSGYNGENATGTWILTCTNAGAGTGTIDAYDLICNYTDISQPIFPKCEYQFEDVLYDSSATHSRNKLLDKDTISLSIIGNESKSKSAL